ncbi:MAG: hypothetical protein IPM29_30170 [Planctomycetes bacterium]|nr:hypothetical protein [Planctomycetota bacterium]
MRRTTLACLLALGGTACSYGIPYAQMKERIPPVPAGMSRVVLVATAASGRLAVDGAVHTDFEPSTFTFVDVAPGPHAMAWLSNGCLNRDAELRRLDVDVAAGEELGIHAVNASWGWIPILQFDRWDPLLLWRQIAEDDLGYVGPALTVAPPDGSGEPAQ